MTGEEMNQLRPKDKIIHEVAKTRTLGVVQSIWRNSHFKVRWQGERSDDEIKITPQGDPHIQKVR